MSHVKTLDLRESLNLIAPKLDYALTEGTLNTHELMGENYLLPPELKRRGGICNATSWLLSAELNRQGHHTSPYAKMGEVHIRNNRYMTHHVVVKMEVDDGRFVDPTHEQFYYYVGLSPRFVLRNPAYEALYPDQGKIAVINPNNTEFQENFAENAHRIERELDGVTNGILTGTTLDEKIDAYKQVWDMNTYKPMFPPRTELRRAISQSAALMDRFTLL